MWNHIEIMFLNGFDMSHSFRSHKGLSVMHEGLSCMKICLSCAMTAIMIHTQCECKENMMMSCVHHANAKQTMMIWCLSNMNTNEIMAPHSYVA